MGGKESKDIQKIDIQNEISVSIKNETENLIKTTTDTVNSASTEIVNDSATSIEASSAAKNQAKLGNISADGPGSEVNVSQLASVASVTTAIAQVTNNTESMTKFANQIENKLKQQTTNDNSIENTLKAINEAKNSTNSQEGVASMVGKIMDTIGGLMKPGEKMSSEMHQNISNKIKTDIVNRTKNSTDVANITKNITSNVLKNMTSNKCNFQSSAENILEAGDISARNGGKVILKQEALVQAFNKCVMGVDNATKMINELTNSNITAADMETFNKNKAKAELDAKNKAENSKTTTDAFADMFKSLTDGIMGFALIIGLAIVGIIVLVVLLPKLFSGSGSGSSDSGRGRGRSRSDDDDDDDQEGGSGNNSNMIVLFIVIIFTLQIMLGRCINNTKLLK
jgi:hypothetical protein